MIDPIDNLPEQIAASLSQPSTPGDLQGLSPALSYGRHGGPPRDDARPASVLVLLYPRDDQWHLPLARRPEYLTQHAGQVSLPGGAQEPGESSVEAALRETREELGVSPRDIQILGSLTPVYVFNSNFFVTPWIAATRQRLEFEPSSDEVAELIELPVNVLLQPEFTLRMEIKRGQLSFTAPCIRWRGKDIWGATYVVLGQFTRLCRRLTP